MPNSLWSHGLQHTRSPCPSPTPRVYSNSCPSCRWCHPTILSSVVPFSSCLQFFPASGVFSNELVLCIRWPKYWSFSFSISPSNEYSRLLSFRMDWLDLLAVQGTLKSLKIYGTVNSNCRFSWHHRMSAKNLIIKDQKWQWFMFSHRHHTAYEWAQFEAKERKSLLSK